MQIYFSLPGLGDAAFKTQPGPKKQNTPPPIVKTPAQTLAKPTPAQLAVHFGKFSLIKNTGPQESSYLGPGTVFVVEDKDSQVEALIGKEVEKQIQEYTKENEKNKPPVGFIRLFRTEAIQLLENQGDITRKEAEAARERDSLDRDNTVEALLEEQVIRTVRGSRMFGVEPTENDRNHFRVAAIEMLQDQGVLSSFDAAIAGSTLLPKIAEEDLDYQMGKDYSQGLRLVKSAS